MFDRVLASLIDNAWYLQTGTVDADIASYCIINGHYSWIDETDDCGNVLDSSKQITRNDFQNAVNELGIIFDVINY